MIEVRALEAATEAAPLLRQLRSTLDDATFATRLSRAVAQGYRVLGAFDATDALLGALGYRVNEDLHWGRTFYLDDLVVDAEARGQGIGAALLAQARVLATQECDHIRLCSGLNRTDAHRFYERAGLRPTSLQFFAVP